MRHFLFSIMAVAAVYLATACQQEVISDELNERVSVITVHATHAATRTGVYYDDQGENPGYKSTWKAGDWISLYEFSSSNFDSDAINYGYSSYEQLASDTDEAVFSISFNEEYDVSLVAPLQYIGVYSGATPINTIENRDEWLEAWGEIPEQPQWGLRGYISYEQTPLSDSFDPDADLLFSQMLDNQSTRPSSVNLAFARVGSIAKITLKGLPEGGTVLSGLFRHDGSWLSTGQAFYDPILGKVAYMTAPIKSASDSDSIIYFYNYDRDLSINAKGEVVIWLRTFSGTLSDHFYITVTVVDDDGKEKEFEKYVDMGSRTITFTEGNITAFGVNMKEKLPITFSAETLKYFPELAPNHPDFPKIRIPQNYCMYNMNDACIDEFGEDGFNFIPLEFESDYTDWDVDIDFDKEEWLDVRSYDPFSNRRFLDGWPFELGTELRSATLVMTRYEYNSEEVAEVIRIPIEEYTIDESELPKLIMKDENGEPMENSTVVEVPALISFEVWKPESMSFTRGPEYWGDDDELIHWEPTGNSDYSVIVTLDDDCEQGYFGMRFYTDHIWFNYFNAEVFLIHPVQ